MRFFLMVVLSEIIQNLHPSNGKELKKKKEPICIHFT